MFTCNHCPLHIKLYSMLSLKIANSNFTSNEALESVINLPCKKDPQPPFHECRLEGSPQKWSCHCVCSSSLLYETRYKRINLFYKMHVFQIFTWHEITHNYKTPPIFFVKKRVVFGLLMQQASIAYVGFVHTRLKQESNIKLSIEEITQKV